MGIVYCKTVPDGQAVAIKERSGAVDVVDGPTQLCAGCITGREFEDCEIVVAGEGEYLIVKFRDGRTEFRPGPAFQVRHPVEHVSINCRSGLEIGDQELIVVYRCEGEAQEAGSEAKAKRTLVRGPVLYIPQSASEWVHEFSWTGPATSNDSISEVARKKIGALKFSKLRTIPGKMYFDVESVRTKDNALITVKLMIFYQLKDVDVMLDNTNDPMGDFVNAVSADVIEWCAPKKFDEFLAATDKLNLLETYGQLQRSAKKVGYQVDRVVFRGYSAPGALQRMHDNAIEKRTALTLSKETEEEEQNMEDFKLKKASERAAQQHKLDLEQLEHELSMKQKKADAESELKRQEQTVELERLTNIKGLDKKGEMAAYLIAKDCQLPATVQCGTLQSGGAF